MCAAVCSTILSEVSIGAYYPLPRLLACVRAVIVLVLTKWQPLLTDTDGVFRLQPLRTAPPPLMLPPCRHGGHGDSVAARGVPCTPHHLPSPQLKPCERTNSWASLSVSSESARLSHWSPQGLQSILHVRERSPWDWLWRKPHFRTKTVKYNLCMHAL